MVRVHDDMVLAGEQPLDQLGQFSMGERDMRYPEGRHNLDAGKLKGGALEDNHGRPPVQFRLTEDIDLGIVDSQEGRDSESVPTP